MNQDKIESLLQKGRIGKYREVVEDYLCLDQLQKLNRLTMYAYADALYELGRDIESLKAYLDFISLHPKEKATSYALIGAAISLKNLDLHEEALDILLLMKPSHEGLEDEIKHSNEKIKLQQQAKTILNNWNQHENQSVRRNRKLDE